MKVYELMMILEQCPAGAEVKFHTLKTLEELPVCEDNEQFREIDCDVTDYDIDNNVVLLIS